VDETQRLTRAIQHLNQTTAQHTGDLALQNALLAAERDILTEDNQSLNDRAVAAEHRLREIEEENQALRDRAETAEQRVLELEEVVVTPAPADGGASSVVEEGPEQ